FTFLSSPDYIIRADRSAYQELQGRDDRSIAGRYARSGAQRGLSTAQLLSPVTLVVAGRDQGRVSGPSEHRSRIRLRDLLTLLHDAAAQRRQPQDLCEAVALSRLHAVQRFPA